MNELTVKFSVSLILTLLLELPVSYLFRVRGRDLLLVFLVNVLTNPVAVLVSTAAGDGLFVQFGIETVVIAVEGWYYRSYGSEIRHPYLCAVVCNLFSYIVGVAAGRLL